MKFIEPSVEYWPQEEGLAGVWHQIARATRICYQSSPRKGESDEDFVKRVILKPALLSGDLASLEYCKFDNDKMHGSMLEHGTVYLTFTDADYANFYIWDSHSIVNRQNDVYFITTNMRTLVEHNRLMDIDHIFKKTKHHPGRYTFKVVTDIGVSREANRHRAFSVAEESTRYNAYDKGKYGSEISYVLPQWFNPNEPLNTDLLDSFNTADKQVQEDNFKRGCEDVIKGAGSWTAEDYKLFALKACEFAYMGMRNLGETAQKCRQVLPLSTKTTVVYTAFVNDWRHFLSLRSTEAVSGKPHPNIMLVADKIKAIMEERQLD